MDTSQSSGSILTTKPVSGQRGKVHKPNQQTEKQALFQNMFVGVLLYTVVIGFFNDYTDVLSTESYSTTFLVSVVMQLLTYATFALKDKIKLFYKNKQGKFVTPALVFSIWLVLFFSKFIFLAVLDFIFGEQVEFSGFIGIFVVIICLTILQKLSEFIYKKLAE